VLTIPSYTFLKVRIDKNLSFPSVDSQDRGVIQTDRLERVYKLIANDLEIAKIGIVSVSTYSAKTKSAIRFSI